MNKAMLFALVVLAGVLQGSNAYAADADAAPAAPERRPAIPGEDRATTIVGEYVSADNMQLVQYTCYDGNIPEDEDSRPGNNPANVQCTAALFLKKSGKWVFADEMGLGQGEVTSFDHFRLTVETVEYGPEDALCCPSVKKTEVYDTRTGKFVERKAAEKHGEQKKKQDTAD